MNISKNDEVNDLLSDIQLASIDQFKTVLDLRRGFLKSYKNFVEGVKYGGLVFNINDNLVAGIFTYKKHISVEFSHGAGFVDKNVVLEGKGQFRRHLKIYNKNDIEDKNCQYFIEQAVKLSP